MIPKRQASASWLPKMWPNAERGGCPPGNSIQVWFDFSRSACNAPPEDNPTTVHPRPIAASTESSVSSVLPEYEVASTNQFSDTQAGKS